MKNFIYFLVLSTITLISCNTAKSVIPNNSNSDSISPSDTIRIVNEKLEYEVIIIEPGFNTWLISRAFPRNYYSQSYLENKNRIWITEWNSRVLQPSLYNPNLYEMNIAYDPTIDYGYEVNYLIYNYLVYFQNTYKQKLFGYVPSR